MQGLVYDGNGIGRPYSMAATRELLTAGMLHNKSLGPHFQGDKAKLEVLSQSQTIKSS